MLRIFKRLCCKIRSHSLDPYKASEWRKIGDQLYARQVNCEDCGELQNILVSKCEKIGALIGDVGMEVRNG